MRKYLVVLTLFLVAAIASGIAGNPQAQFTDDFNIEDLSFKPNGGNPYFSLKPGIVLQFEGEDDGELIELEIKVLNQTKTITFNINGQSKTVKTRVIREREWTDGELVEVSFNYFARSKHTGDIYYFGEDVNIYHEDGTITHEGAWIAGQDGALPGLIMPSVFLLGARYYQEVAPAVALDRAEHVEMGLVVETPAGTFEDCVMVVETSPLEPNSESVKVYAPGVGLIMDDELVLVDWDDDDDD